MEQEKLQEILEKHKKWLNDEEGGERADLYGANLRGAYLHEADLYGANLRGAYLSEANMREANLRGADLSGANLHEADLYGANLRGAYLSEANLREANLSGADLSGANLHEADLHGADLDFSCLPLWCGSLSAQFDDRQLKQIAYHLVKAGLQSKNASDETKAELSKLIDFANGFHRVEECGKIEPHRE